MAPSGAAMIQNRYSPGANPATTLKKKIIAAGITPWPKLLQNLRASRETELMAKYPVKDATAWIGNSVAVANKHYAMKLRESFSRSIMEGATPQITPQSGLNRDRIQETEKKGIAQNPVKGGIFLDLSCLVDEANDPYGTRTRVTAVKGRCPRPLDEGAPVRFESSRSITVERVLPNF